MKRKKTKKKKKYLQRRLRSHNSSPTLPWPQPPLPPNRRCCNLLNSLILHQKMILLTILLTLISNLKQRPPNSICLRKASEPTSITSMPSILISLRKPLRLQRQQQLVFNKNHLTIFQTLDFSTITNSNSSRHSINLTRQPTASKTFSNLVQRSQFRSQSNPRISNKNNNSLKFKISLETSRCLLLKVKRNLT